MNSILLLTLSVLGADSTPANEWQKLEDAKIVGRRWDVPLGYDPAQKQFLVLGGRTSFGDYKQPRSYDVLGLGSGDKQWENLFPTGKDWGEKYGACSAPGWKDEHFRFDDREGNVRPNWTVYGTFSLGTKYDYDSDTKKFFFYAGGKTFSYDPAQREWKDLEPATHPEKELTGKLLWSSMCYDAHNQRFILFGGGNVQTERGDPGTWSYTPATNAWKQLELDVQPPQRANSRLCYDPEHKQVVLFGGDRLDQLLADTWTFDVVKNQWSGRKQRSAPSPRAGHALLWMPKMKRVMLLGGYAYTSTTGYCESLYRSLPLQAWILSDGFDTWEPIGYFDAKGSPKSPSNGSMAAAVNENDHVLVTTNDGAWLYAFEESIELLQELEVTFRNGKPEHPDSVPRVGPHDPDWYQDVPAADPQQVARELKDLPANEWVLRPTPKLAAPNMDWGSAVFDAAHDKIVRFSGGHSAYSGTAPHVYDVKTDRYSIPFAPEYPIEYVYSNDQVDGEWSFQGRPWMTGHTYKSTGYDPGLKQFVFAPHDYTYFFDVTAGKWSRSTEKNPYRSNFYTVTLCATPAGAVCWADDRENGKAGLWRLEAKSKSWQPLPLTDTLHDKSPDEHGLAFDSKRNRLLFFSGVGKNKGDVAAYDFSSGEAKWLDAAGKDKAVARSRETIYLPESDQVLIGARVFLEDQPHWLLYDCQKNAWFGVELPGADPVVRGKEKLTFNNSMGLMYDPARKLIWAVGQHSHVHVLRFDPATAKLKAL